MTTLCAFALLVTVESLSCPPPLETMPLLATWYDPALGGINCQEPCNVFADGTAVTEDSYNVTAACLPQWLGRDIVVVGLGTFKCRDTGGGIVVEWNEYYGRWVIRLDVLAHEEISCNYCLWEWRLN